MRESCPITTLIFDVDDTLYDVGTGFTAHRNGYGAQSFMVHKLGFRSAEEAKAVRDKYFEIYHSTAKALTVADQAGLLPKGPFCPQDLAEWWAEKLDYSLLGECNISLQQDLKDCDLNMVAFSNGPRKYVKRVLKELGLWEYFGDDRLFAVDDVLPHCKPEPEAFQVVFDKLGVTADECVMIEDSMKNIRKAKNMGVRTVLVTGLGRSKKNRINGTKTAADDAEATKPGDAPVEDDPAVDVSIETVDELRTVLPGLWESPAVFEPIKPLYS